MWRYSLADCRYSCNTAGKGTNSWQTSTPGAFYAIYSTDRARAGQRLQESKDTAAQGMAVGRVGGEIRIREKQEHIMEEMGREGKDEGQTLFRARWDGKGHDRTCAGAVQKPLRNQRINRLKKLETRTLVFILLLKMLSLISLEERTIMHNVFVQDKIHLLQCIKKLLDKTVPVSIICSQMQS